MIDRAKSKIKTSGAKSSKGKPSGSASAGANRVRKHRAKMKALGLKPVLLWLPDVNASEFKARSRATSRPSMPASMGNRFSKSWTRLGTMLKAGQ